MQKLQIEQTENGYIIVGKFNDNEEKTKIVIEEQDDDGAGLIAMQCLLWQIKEYFGIYNSKHNKKNLVIEIESNKSEALSA